MIWWITGGLAAIGLALIAFGLHRRDEGGDWWLLVLYGLVLLVVAGVVLLGWWLWRLIFG